MNQRLVSNSPDSRDRPSPPLPCFTSAGVRGVRPQSLLPKSDLKTPTKPLTLCFPNSSDGLQWDAHSIPWSCLHTHISM